MRFIIITGNGGSIEGLVVGNQSSELFSGATLLGWLKVGTPPIASYTELFFGAQQRPLHLMFEL